MEGEGTTGKLSHSRYPLPSLLSSLNSFSFLSLFYTFLEGWRIDIGSHASAQASLKLAAILLLQSLCAGLHTLITMYSFHSSE